MPLVEVNEIIPVPIQRVWEVVNDVESYPQLMANVRSLSVIERQPDYRLTAWEVDFKACIMRWTERESIDAEKYRIDYRQVEGDLAQFEGYWQLEPITAESTRAILLVQFDIGIPMLSEMINPVAETAIRSSSQQMLMSLAEEAARPTEIQELS